MLTGVSAVWDAEADLEVKGFEQEVSEIMPLDQTEAGQGLAAHSELQPERQAANQLQGNTCINFIRGPTVLIFDGARHMGSKSYNMHVHGQRWEVTKYKFFVTVLK